MKKENGTIPLNVNNGDKVRKMTDKQLAELFNKIAGSSCQFCIYKCDYGEKDCIEGHKLWLKRSKK